MNDPAVKVALALSVLMGGVFIALVFRPVFSAPPGTMAEMNAPLSLQHQGQSPLSSNSQERPAVSESSAGVKSASSSASSRGPTVLLPLGAGQRAPDSPPRYPAAASTNNARWGMPMDMMPIAARDADGPRIHKIVDGDTLGDLAARYLGSAARAMEIFAANRDLLTDPKLLPIGVELKIPAHNGGNK
jgi:nucleoid-associated protein YgaU